MGYQIKLSFLLMTMPLLSFAMPHNNEDYWICKAHDNANYEWSAQNIYQKMALNLAFNACKKASKSPVSCKTSEKDCEEFRQGITTKPFWRCIAQDGAAESWYSNYYQTKDDAALAAKAYCQDKSSVPESCYINLLTCINVNEGR